MSNYDSDVLGVGNPMHPANQEDCQEEAMTVVQAIDEVRDHFNPEVAQTIEDYIDILERRLKRSREQQISLKAHLKRLSEFDEALSIFGTITFDEQTERTQILNSYK
jgi:hypothetical protein